MLDDVIKPWHLPASDCADYLGITKTSFSRRGYDPFIKSGRHVFYDITDICLKEAGAGKYQADDGEVPDKAAEEARLTKARRVSQELQNIERQGLVAPVDLFGATFGDFASQIVQTLEGLPGDIRRADPEISARSLEVVEGKIAEFRNLAADLCAKLAKSAGGEVPEGRGRESGGDLSDEATNDGGAVG